MNHELSLDDNLPDTPAARGGFYQAVILRALAPMARGFLELELPDGARKKFGDPAAEIRAHVRIRRPRFFQRCVLFGDIGFGESYVDGDWDTDSVERGIASSICFARIVCARAAATSRIITISETSSTSAGWTPP